MRRLTVFLAATAASVAMIWANPLPADAASPCSTVRVGTLKAAPVPVLGWSENLAYDRDGALWVTRTAMSTVERLDDRGRVTASVSVPFPGGIAAGPDGRMYVTSFSKDALGLLRTGRIYSFDPAAAQPKTRIYTQGLGFPNGLAFDAKGNAYVGDTWQGVLKVLPGGRVDRRWSSKAPRNLTPSTTVNGSSMNGVAVDGDNLYVTMTTSVSGRVLKVPLAQPNRTSVAADLTAPIPGIVDDLTVVRRGTLAVTTTTGQLFIANTVARTQCVVQLGQPATSVAVNPDDATELAVGTELGDILRVSISGLAIT